MFAEREGVPVVKTDDLIDAVGELKPAVFDADLRIGEGKNASVNPDQVGHGGILKMGEAVSRTRSSRPC